MENAKISVIMPAYNSEKYVSEAMDSILAQTYQNWELIAVDDGSTDRTGSIIDEYSAGDSRIQAVHTENKGVSRARNIGLDMARGEWIAFLDSDDRYETDAFASMLREGSNANLIIGNFRLIPEIGTRKRIVQTKVYGSFKEIKPNFDEYLSAGVLNAVWGKLIRRDIVSVRFCEGCNHGEDGLFLISLLESVGQIQFIPQTVYVYRRDNENSLSHRLDYDYERSVECIAKSCISYFNDAHITKMMYARYLNGIITRIKSMYHQAGYQDDYIREYISSLISSDFLRQIPLVQYPLTPYRQRMATLLLIGDVDMIMDELAKKRK